VTSLRYKIGLSYFVIVVIGLATSAFAVYNFSNLRDTFSLMLHDNYESVRAAQNMLKAFGSQENAQLSMLIQDNDAYLQFSTNRNSFLGWLEKAKQGNLNAREKIVLDRITQDSYRYTQLTDSLYRLLQMKRQTADATEFRTSLILPVAK
jgi:two-component system, NtrC family, sensor histidine kinase KinB